MVEPLLSICIPTYNFGRFIGMTLESIVSQLPAAVQIVVLDGGSTDDTSQVVAGFQARCPQLAYHRLANRGGIDRDMARTVELAAGRYCWLFSGDDVMRPDSIARVLDLIKSGRDVYLCKHTMCSLDMTVQGERPVLNIASEASFELSDPVDRQRYCRLAQTTEAFFSFMGGIIVARSKWLSIPLNEDFVGSCWAHVARLFELARSGLSVTYVPQLLLDRRGDNDSFADRGVVNRYRIAIEGYHRLAATFFAHDAAAAFHVRRVIRNEFGFRMFLGAKLQSRRNPRAEDPRLLNQLLKRAYRDVPVRGLLIRAGYTAIPAWLFPALRSLHRAVGAPLSREL